MKLSEMSFPYEMKVELLPPLSCSIDARTHSVYLSPAPMSAASRRRIMWLSAEKAPLLWKTATGMPEVTRLSVECVGSCPTFKKSSHRAG